MTSLATVDPSILERSGAKVTPTSLSLNGELSYDVYEALGAFLGQVNNSSRFWLGDWLLYGEALYGERYAQAAIATQLSPQTLANVQSICHRVPPQRRLAGVSFSCHAEVAALEPAEQKSWLQVADEERLTKGELRARIRDEGPDVQPQETCRCCGQKL